MSDPTRPDDVPHTTSLRELAERYHEHVLPLIEHRCEIVVLTDEHTAHGDGGEQHHGGGVQNGRHDVAPRAGKAPGVHWAPPAGISVSAAVGS